MKPININFKPSSWLATLIICASLGACWIVVFVGLAWQVKLALLVLIVLSSAYSAAKALLLLPASVIAANINIKHEVKFNYKDGRQVIAQIKATSLVNPYLTVVHYQEREARLLRRLFVRSIVILPDTLTREDFRSLRVWLRWGQHTSA